ncbi:hypothetical protein AB0O68_15580 [Streptomyces sp. NPDC087512]|uniref:hypothetical protein n=1 Tax=Streptomyces sp. NPDC087512 TaxID=3155059 RepID=UPI00342C8B0A
MNAERYQVTVTSAGRPAIHGWWGREETARAAFTKWIGEYGNLPDARVTLMDEETGTVLTTWPDEG